MLNLITGYLPSPGLHCGLDILCRRPDNQHLSCATRVLFISAVAAVLYIIHFPVFFDFCIL